MVWGSDIQNHVVATDRRPNKLHDLKHVGAQGSTRVNHCSSIALSSALLRFLCWGDNSKMFGTCCLQFLWRAFHAAVSIWLNKFKSEDEQTQFLSWCQPSKVLCLCGTSEELDSVCDKRLPFHPAADFLPGGNAKSWSHRYVMIRGGGCVTCGWAHQQQKSPGSHPTSARASVPTKNLLLSSCVDKKL